MSDYIGGYKTFFSKDENFKNELVRNNWSVLSIKRTDKGFQFNCMKETFQVWSAEERIRRLRSKKLSVRFTDWIKSKIGHERKGLHA